MIKGKANYKRGIRTYVNRKKEKKTIVVTEVLCVVLSMRYCLYIHVSFFSVLRDFMLMNNTRVVTPHNRC